MSSRARHPMERVVKRPKKEFGAARGSEDGAPAPPHPPRESYQLKTINACVWNPDIALPSRPTPGALVNFYLTGCWREQLSAPPAEEEETDEGDRAAVTAPASRCSGKRAARRRAARQPPARSLGGKRSGDAIDNAADEVVDVEAEEADEGDREAERDTHTEAATTATAAGVSATVSGVGDGGRGEGNISWLRLAALCRKRKAQTMKRVAPKRSLAALRPSPTLAAAVTPSQWMQSVPHVVLGRHALLPVQLRLRHPFISRMHARVVWVEHEVMHACLTAMFPPVFAANAPHRDTGARRSRGRGGRRTEARHLAEEEEEEQEEVYVSDFDFEKPYYLLISYGENPLFVNGLRVPHGCSWPLQLGDVLSFLESALDVEYGVATRHSVASNGEQGQRSRLPREAECFSLSSVSSRGSSSRASSASSTRSSRGSLSGVLVPSDDSASEPEGRGRHEGKSGEPAPPMCTCTRRRLRDAPSVGRSQPFLDTILHAALRSCLLDASPAASLLHFTTGTCALRLLPGAVDVSPAARRFVSLWMGLLSALRCGDDADGGDEAAHAASIEHGDVSGSFVVARNHLLVREDGRAGRTGARAALRDLSVFPAVTERTQRRRGSGGRKAKGDKKGIAHPADGDSASHDGEESSADEGSADAEEGAESRRVRHFLRRLARELERIARHQRANGDDDDPFPEDVKDDEGSVADEVASPLRARLALDAKALYQVYLSLLAQAEREGHVTVSSNREDSAPPLETRAPSATPVHRGLFLTKNADRGNCAGATAPVATVKDEGDDDDDDVKDSADRPRGPSGAADAESPIRRLLRQLRQSRSEDSKPQSPTASTSPVKEAGRHPNGRSASVTTTPQKPCDALVTPLKLQSPNFIVSGSSAGRGGSLAGASGSNAEARSGADDAADSGAWQERPEDGFGNPLGVESSIVVGSTCDSHPTMPLRLSMTQQLSQEYSCQGGDGGDGGNGGHHRHATEEAPSLAALLAPENKTAYRAVPALALHPAVLPVYIFTRRSPSPDATTTRFTRQSRAANRDADNPTRRPEYVFYYDEEEQEAFEQTVTSPKPGELRCPPRWPDARKSKRATEPERQAGGDDEGSFWVDEAAVGATAVRAAARKRAAPLVRSAPKQKARKPRRKG